MGGRSEANPGFLGHEEEDYMVLWESRKEEMISRAVGPSAMSTHSVNQ